MLFGKQTYAHGSGQARRKDMPREFKNPKSLKVK